MARLLVLALTLLALSSLTLASTRRELWGVDSQFQKFMWFLRSNGYSTFANLIEQYGVTGIILGALQGGTKVTVLVPSNEAFNNLPHCNINIKNALLDHFIPKYLPRRCIKRAPVGALLPTFGRDNVIKSGNDPIVVKLKRGNRSGFADPSDDSADVSQPIDGSQNIGNAAGSNNGNVEVTNVNNGNINDININGNNNNVQINNYNNDDSYGVDYGDYDHSDDYNDSPDGVSCAEATIVGLNIFRKRSIVAHQIDKVLALCKP